MRTIFELKINFFIKIVLKQKVLASILVPQMYCPGPVFI